MTTLKETSRAPRCRGSHRWKNIQYDPNGCKCICIFCKSILFYSMQNGEAEPKVVTKYFKAELAQGKTYANQPRNTLIRDSNKRFENELKELYKEAPTIAERSDV